MGALEGLRILDMTQYEAGTSCTQALAILGADVVKVESPEYGDPGRRVGLGSDGGYSSYFVNWNANKRSITIDLRNKSGKKVFFDLVPNFDIFVENYGPGVVERLGIDYNSLTKVHPELIYARLKGFGTSGPYSHYKSYDMVAQAAAGAMSVTGEADGRPMRPGPTIGDTGTGVQLGMAVLAAYIQRQRTGEGQEIEISMQEAMTYYMRTQIATGSAWGTKASGRHGTSGGLPPVDLYPCKPGGPNDWIYLMPITSGHWDALCAAIDRPDLIVDERYANPRDRIDKSDEVYEIFASWTRTRTKVEAMEHLADAGVPCSAVMDTAELHNDPHLLARDFVLELDFPIHGRVPLLGFAPNLSKSENRLTPPPLLGEHTKEILVEVLGLGIDEVNALQIEGAFGEQAES